MSSVFKSLHRRAAWVAAVACLVLAGCGGGGGDVAVPQSVQILDSFGNVVAAGGADGVGPGDSGGDGTAGDGAPIVGGVVTVTDSTGKSVSATTDAQGYYRVKLTGFTPPFVVKVARPDGKVRHSLSVKTPADQRLHQHEYQRADRQGGFRCGPGRRQERRGRSDPADRGGECRGDRPIGEQSAQRLATGHHGRRRRSQQLRPAGDAVPAEPHRDRLRAGQHRGGRRRRRFHAGQRVAQLRAAADGNLADVHDGGRADDRHPDRLAGLGRSHRA